MYRGGGKDNFIFSIYFLSNRYNSLTSFHVCISFIYIIYICVCVYLFFLLFFFFLQTTCRLFSRGSRGFSNSLLEKRGSHSRQNILLVEGFLFFIHFSPFFSFFFLSSFFFSPFFVTNQRRVKASQTIGH